MNLNAPYELETCDPISSDMLVYGLRSRIDMLERLICRIAKELPPGACSQATRSSIDGVVVAWNSTDRKPQP
jgi:hypothetical protein